METIGQSIKYQREKKGLSQAELARQTGLKQQMISWWEADKGIPGVDFCIVLADFFGISIDELVGRSV